MTHRTRAAGRAAACLAAGLAAASCGRETTAPAANRAPHVRIVTGPVVDRDTLENLVEIHWLGWDDDGFVTRYQVAVDPGSSVGDSATGWRDTATTSVSMTFSTTLPETVQSPDGGRFVTDRYLGDHTFAVRAFDDRGAVSEPDVISFTFVNRMPRTTITSPKGAQYAALGAQAYVSWSGVDPDKSSPDLKPVAYEYKLIPIPSVFASSDPQYAVDVSPGPSFPWTRVPGSVEQIRLDLEVPGSYWFIVRALDDLGAVENVFVSGLNAVKIEASRRNYDRPLLTVWEANTGPHVFPDDGLVVALSIYRDECLSFEFEADLSSYGGVFVGYNVGIDVADVDDTSPSSGFFGWTRTPRPLTPICFRAAGRHYVTILCRDTAGGVTVGTYSVDVQEIPARDRDVLYVDDYPKRSVGDAVDRAMDERARRLLEAAGFSEAEIHVAEPWGSGDRSVSVAPLTRGDLDRYRLIVWEVEGGGSIGSGGSALAIAAGCDRRWLRRYLDQGGSLWIYGTRVLGALSPPAGGFLSSCGVLPSYNTETGLDLRSYMLPCLVMGLCGGDIRLAQSPERARKDGLVRAVPTAAGSRAGLPGLEADSTAYNAALLGGLPGIEAAFGPIVGDHLEPLYRMKAAREESYFNDRAVAWSYDDPGVEGTAVAVFAFPFHQMKEGSVAEGTGVLGLARSLGDWFRQRMIPGL